MLTTLFSEMDLCAALARIVRLRGNGIDGEVDTDGSDNSALEHDAAVQQQRLGDGGIELAVVGVGIGDQARQVAASVLPPGRVTIVESALQQL